MDSQKIEKMKKMLEERGAELEASSRGGDDDGGPVILDQQRMGRLSRIDAMQVQAMLQETDRRKAIEQSGIKAALERIEKGDYGYCVKCDEEITDKRLEVDPSAPMCIACAELSERR